MMIRTAVLLAVIAVPTAQAQGCSQAIAGTTCVVVPPSQIRPPPLPEGTMLPRGEYFMLMNAPYYGLPRAHDGWVYFRIEDEIARVRLSNMELLEYVTDQANSNF